MTDECYDMNFNEAEKLVNLIVNIAKAAVADDEYKHSDYAGAEVRKACVRAVVELATCCDTPLTEQRSSPYQKHLKCDICGTMYNL